MLVFSRAQLDAWRRRSIVDFSEALYLYYTQTFPLQMRDRAPADIVEMIDWARAAQIVRRYDVQRLGEVLLASGAEFTRRPTSGWISDILSLPEIDGTSRIDRLREAELARDAAEDRHVS